MKLELRQSGYSIKFSPFFPDRIAVATAHNFGIVGTGYQSVVQRGAHGLEEVWSCTTAQGVFDCAWSENHSSILISACGDGSIKVFETEAKPETNPIRTLCGHVKEVSSVSWNPARNEQFISTSWDDTVKLWSFGGSSAINTFCGHSYCVYAAAWNPGSAHVFGTASGDQSVKIWDTRQPKPSVTLQAHNAEILSLDWCKYNDCVFATGSVDKLIRTWDVRAPSSPISEFCNHRYAVRKVLFSPHTEHLLLSCSYDMTVRLWDISSNVEDALLKTWDHHTEFAIGIDFSIHEPGVVGSVGWDGQLYMWHHDGNPRD